MQLREQSLREGWGRVSLCPFPLDVTVGPLGGVDEQLQRVQIAVPKVEIAAIGLRPRGEQPCRQRRFLGVEFGGHAFEDGVEDPPCGHPTQLLGHFQGACHPGLLIVDPPAARCASARWAAAPADV